MPSPASCSAAASASGTVEASATTVTSAPGRATRRLAERDDVTFRGAASPLLANSPLCSKNTTGSSLRIADAIRPTTSAGVDGRGDLQTRAR